MVVFPKRKKTPGRKHYYQQFYYSSGAACLRMVLSNFHIYADEDELIEDLNTTEEGGTSFASLIRCATRKYGMYCKFGEGGDIELLDHLISTGWSVIVAYTTDQPHYACYLGYNGNHVFLNDPFLGPRHAIVLPKFMRKWKIQEKNKNLKHFNSNGWYVAFQEKIPF